MGTMTRRAFGRGLGALAAAQALGACTSGGPAGPSGDPGPAVRDYVRPGSPPDFSGVDWGHVSPDPAGAEGTVLTASPAPGRRQCLFLWEEGRAPTTTASGAGGSDPADFRPPITAVPAAAGAVRGAVLLCAGGAFSIRGDDSDCYPTAQRLSALGYQCFVVDYRVHPYTQAESGCDLARAIRFVRARAEDYHLPSQDAIALGGYSAGGILCGETILNWSGAVAPTRLDPAYAPDALDAVSADAAATAMIYSFYGRLSVAELDPGKLKGVIPTYYCYGTEDPFYGQFEAQVGVMAGLGVALRARVLDGWPHGFGAEGGWIEEYDAFVQEALAAA